MSHPRTVEPGEALRALHVLPRVIAEASGPSHTVPRLCRGLAALGLEVELSCLEPLPERSLSFPATAYPTRRFPGAYRLGVSPALRRALSRAAPAAQIMHSHSLWMMPNIYPGRAVRGTGCKLVISPRGTLEPWAWARSRLIKSLVWTAGQRATLEAAHLFHATATSECQAIRDRGLRQPVAIIPNGVDVPEFLSTARQEAGGRTLLFLSRIHEKKQVDRLLRAWQLLEPAFPAWRLCVAGPLDNAYARDMQQLARELRLERVEFPGEISGDRKWQRLGAADVFVLPTRSENFGLAIAEALAAGTPVVTTHGAPWPGLEQHGCGWWIADRDDDLQRALRQALALPVDELRVMGERGRAWVLRDFGWDGVAEKMAASYRWLLGQCDRPDWVVC